ELGKVSRFRMAGIALPVKDSLKKPLVRQVLGLDITKQLNKGPASIEGCEVFLLTEKIDPHAFVAGPILAVHILPKYLAELMRIDRNATDIIYVPWTIAERDIFVDKNPNATAI